MRFTRRISCASQPTREARENSRRQARLVTPSIPHAEISDGRPSSRRGDDSRDGARDEACILAQASSSILVTAPQKRSRFRSGAAERIDFHHARQGWLAADISPFDASRRFQGSPGISQPSSLCVAAIRGGARRATDERTTLHRARKLECLPETLPSRSPKASGAPGPDERDPETKASALLILNTQRIRSSA